MRTKVMAVVMLLGLPFLGAIAQESGGPANRNESRRPRERGPRDDRAAQNWRPPVMPIIATLDANGDGVIDADELAKSAEALKKLDKDGDGKLTEEELRPARPGGRGGLGGPEGPGMGGPGGRGGPGGPEGPGRLGGPPMGPPDERSRAGQDAFTSSPLAKDEAEKKVLAVLEEMDKERAGMMSVPRDDGRFLRMITESIGAKNVVEVGTSQGYSAIWLCLALRTTGGKLTTFEIDTERAALARKNFKRAGVDAMVTLIEGDAHQEVSKLKEPIDLLFLDADKEGYLDYLEKLLPLLRPGGLVVAHNMNARQADPRYVKAITTDPKIETLFVNLGGSGISLTLKKR